MKQIKGRVFHDRTVFVYSFVSKITGREDVETITFEGNARYLESLRLEDKHSFMRRFVQYLPNMIKSLDGNKI